MVTAGRAHEAHPYLSGNYAPVQEERALTECDFEGTIPEELFGGQYIRNGGNPMANADANRDAHWFDGDGMLTGVLFRVLEDGKVRPEFINRYIVTDVLLSTTAGFRRPLLPSISLFSSPHASPLLIVVAVLRAVILSFLSWLPFVNAVPQHQRLKRIAVANTSIWWHDGRAYAGCESGPPMRVLLPGLDTVGWWTGGAEKGEQWAKRPGPAKVFDEMTTAHPRIDPRTGDLLLYHMSFLPPYLRVSVVPAKKSPATAVWGAPVPGVKQPKMAHDFGVSAAKTIMLDLPLSLDPMNWAKGRPMLHFDHLAPTRFGIFPRREPHKVRWYESPEACCIYHTANAWDEEPEGEKATSGSAVNLLACRLNSATLIYSAGNVIPPAHAAPKGSEERCQLYYWRFADTPEPSSPFPSPPKAPALDQPTHEFALSSIPFEFPTLNEKAAQRRNRFVFGASMRDGCFDAGLGRQSAKIDCLAKIDAAQLVDRGRRLWDSGKLQRGEAVDTRSVRDILEDQQCSMALGAEPGPIQIFALPDGCYAQEATFVARRGATSEDDGWLVFFVFDEDKGLDAAGQPLQDAQSELWVIDATNMTDVVARVRLPQRVPYGLHGHFFSSEDIAAQEPVAAEEVRSWALAAAGVTGPGLALDSTASGKLDVSGTRWYVQAAKGFRSFVQARLG